MEEKSESKEIRRKDFIACQVLDRMSLTLDYNLRFKTGAAVPKLWHWLFFLPRVKASQTRPDGHPATGGFLPDLEGLGRRMWAGGRFRFHDDLIAGQHAEKVSQFIY